MQTDIFSQALQYHKDNQGLFLHGANYFDYSVFEVSFAFDDFDGDDLFSSKDKDKAQIICHEFFHYYQTIALKTVSEYASLHRYKLGIITFFIRNYMKDKEKIIDINFLSKKYNGKISILDYYENFHHVLPSNMVKLFNDWAEHYVYLENIINSNDKFIRHLIETSATIFQNIKIPNHSQVYIAGAYIEYQKLHDDFKERYAHLSLSDEELNIYHLVIIHFSLGFPDTNFIYDVYQCLIENFELLVKNASILSIKDIIDNGFTSIDLLHYYYYDSYDFIENYYTVSDTSPEFNIEFNHFMVNLFGSSNTDKHYFIDKETIQKQPLSSLEILYCLDFDEKFIQNNHLILAFVLAIESHMSDNFQYSRKEYYESLIKVQDIRSFVSVKNIGNQQKGICHPFFLVKIIEDDEMLTVIARDGYCHFWTSLQQNNQDLIDKYDEIPENQRKHINYDKELLLFHEFEKLIVNKRAKCCDKHGVVSLIEFFDCTETYGLKTRLEKYFNRNIDHILTF